MTVFDLIDALESIQYSDNTIDPEVFIQIGDIQAPIVGIKYFPEVDALELLKAQEPKLVTNIHKEHNNVLNPNVPWVGKCPKCGKKIEGRNLTRFCKFCGQAVKWDG